MKTFVAENPLPSYSYSIIVVKTTSRRKAIEIIKKEFPDHGFYYRNCKITRCVSEYCLKHRLREMKDDEILYVWESD
jgi:hypothetical protein